MQATKRKLDVAAADSDEHLQGKKKIHCLIQK